MDVGNQCGFRGRACLFPVQFWPEFTLSRFELNKTWFFSFARFNLKIWGRQWINVMQSTKFSEKIHFWPQNEQACNVLPSHGPGNEETSRKWGSPSDTEASPGLPRIIVGAIFDANCELQGSATVFLRKLNLSSRWTVCFLGWEAALKILNHGKRVNCKMSVTETF